MAVMGKNKKTYIYVMLIPNYNAKCILNLSFGTTLEPGLGYRDEIMWPRSKLSCLGRKTHTTGKFDSAGHTNAMGAPGKTGPPSSGSPGTLHGGASAWPEA